MCAHYDPVLDAAKLQMYFGVSDLPPPELQTGLWPGQVGPFVRKHQFVDVGDEAVPSRELLTGVFGIIPQWAEEKFARHTYNARSETVHEKNSFKDSWRKARHCIIPADAIFEPDWRSGKPIQTRIVRTDGKPMGIAGLWTGKRQPTGEILHSFTMLTINADDHQFMRNYHESKKEKRMIVILEDEEYDSWLSAPAEESRIFLRQYPSEKLKVSLQESE